MSDIALILFSHGSLLCGAGEILKGHAARLRTGYEFAAVEVGYLNYSEPSFEIAVDRCASAGARKIVVVPYFLVAGKFVTMDLPPRVKSARARYPGIEFVLAEAILDSAGMADALIGKAADARPLATWRESRMISKDVCENRKTCPAFGTPLCPRFESVVTR